MKKLPARIAARKRNNQGKVVAVPVSRDLVRFMTEQGLGERRALFAIQMSPSVLRCQSAPDRNQALRERIVALAQRHRRYGAGMIYLKLRQEELVVNHKRVDRLTPDSKAEYC